MPRKVKSKKVEVLSSLRPKLRSAKVSKVTIPNSLGENLRFDPGLRQAKPRVEPQDHARVDDSVIVEEYRLEDEKEVVPEPKKTTPYLSHYEYAALIHARAMQFLLPGRSPTSEGSDATDALVIAEREVRAYVPNLVVRRKLLDGTVEDWYLTDRTLVFPRI
jgi:DNA-directed RNA polymerase subunit K/omega